MNLNIYEKQNIRRTWVLFIVFFAIIFLLSSLVSSVYQNSMYLRIGVIFTIFYSLISYYFSASIALKFANAKKIEEKDNPELYSMVSRLSLQHSIPMPSLYITPETQINAFATGRNPKNSAVAVTVGALQKLNTVELEGVLAHELSHVKNRDILVSTVAAILAGVVSIVADFFLRSVIFGNRDRENGGSIIFVLALSFLAPIGTALIQMAISRKRESLADITGVEMTHNPEGLASALQKIKMDSTPMLSAKTATAHMWIENPFKKNESMFKSLFMTHPPIDDRINMLRNLKI